MLTQAPDSLLEERATEGTDGWAVKIERLAWPDIAELQKQQGGLLLLPTGATEQHGPHLPVNCDTLIAQAVCWRASALCGVPVLPALPITVSAGHTAKWPGTFSLRHETYIAMLREIAAWAVATGWERLLIVNSHFGNDASQRVAVDQIRTEFLGGLQVAAKNTFNLTPAIWESFIADAADLHANKAETDLLLHLAPELVRTERPADDPDRTTDAVFSYSVAQTSLNGVTGTPSAASARDGRELFQQMGRALADIATRAATEAAPLGEAHWAGLPQPFEYA
jgi:creatinine amidohydrolase